MALNKVKLGELIKLSDEKNVDEQFGLQNVRGISTQKTFITTKADMEGVSLKNYKIVKPNYFAYVSDTSRRGDKISLAYNNSENSYLVSSISTVFYICNDILNPEYLFMFFNRIEFDRYSRYNSWGSARETFSWAEMCDMEIELPPIEIQKKYVAIYNAMVENQKFYETGLEDLKLVCDAYIENLRRNMESEEIGKYITQINLRNENKKVTEIQGVENTGKFIKTKAKSKNLEIGNYKLVNNENIAYNPSRINLGSIAIKDGKTCIVSPMYVVFEVSDKQKLLPNYLMLWLTRNEFFRSTIFYAEGSVRDTFSFETMKKVKIPIPSLEIQQDIVNIYNAYNLRKQINEKLKEQMKSICPILIKGAIEEAKNYGGKNGI